MMTLRQVSHSPHSNLRSTAFNTISLGKNTENESTSRITNVDYVFQHIQPMNKNDSINVVHISMQRHRTAIPTLILEVSGSNFGVETSYTDSGKYENSTSNLVIADSYKSFPVNYSLIVL
jgi:hypothetical protein